MNNNILLDKGIILSSGEISKDKTNLGGKLNISVDLEPGRAVKVDVKKVVE